jgi:hypothetical protein
MRREHTSMWRHPLTRALSRAPSPARGEGFLRALSAGRLARSMNSLETPSPLAGEGRGEGDCVRHTITLGNAQ